jgi:transposase
MVAFWLPIMLTQEEAVEIKVLMRRGAGIREMARELGCSRNTIRRYPREAGAERYGARLARPTKLDPYKDYVLERIGAARPHGIPAVVLLREIKERSFCVPLAATLRQAGLRLDLEAANTHVGVG